VGSAGRESTATLRLELGFAGAQETGTLSHPGCPRARFSINVFPINDAITTPKHPAPTAASSEPSGFQQCRPALILHGCRFPAAASARGGTRGPQSRDEGMGNAPQFCKSKPAGKEAAASSAAVLAGSAASGHYCCSASRRGCPANEGSHRQALTPSLQLQLLGEEQLPGFCQPHVRAESCPAPGKKSNPPPHHSLGVQPPDGLNTRSWWLTSGLRALRLTTEGETPPASGAPRFSGLQLLPSVGREVEIDERQKNPATPQRCGERLSPSSPRSFGFPLKAQNKEEDWLQPALGYLYSQFET